MTPQSCPVTNFGIALTTCFLSLWLVGGQFIVYTYTAGTVLAYATLASMLWLLTGVALEHPVGGSNTTFPECR